MDAIEGWLVNTTEEFSAPVPFNLFNNLMSEYEATRQRLEAMATAVSSERCSGVLRYFVDANAPESRCSMPNTVAELFDLKPAIAQLNAEFWERVLKLTDVLDCMPQKRKDEWYAQIRNPMGKRKQYSKTEWEVHPIFEFNAENARLTIETALGMRVQFFSERVDGIFQSMSRTHVTNSPKGFRQRMILNRALSYGSPDWSTAGVINDLRCVIAKLMGRDEPGHGVTEGVIRVAKARTGKWVSVDGGALRIRVYAGVGTAHLEVHPEMAGRLNAILANLYPMTIPHDFVERKKPKRVRDHKVFSKPIPFAVLSLLSSMKPGYRLRKNPGWNEPKLEKVPLTLMFDHGERDKVAEAQAEAILQAIGGVWVKDGNLDYWKFDYDTSEVLDDIICSGEIPDHQSHQFYPTPENVAAHAIALASAGSAPGMSWLEPSAGIGNLAGLMPRGSTHCIEISELHASILRAKGHSVTVADFLQAPTDPKFDRIVMNPPFSQGRWQAHIEHASRLLAVGGRLVAILPASARGKALLPGFNAVWSDVLENQFAGTCVAVTILSAERI